LYRIPLDGEPLNRVVQGVAQAVLVAAILWLASSVRDLVVEIHELRRDVDGLYAIVSEDIQNR